MLQALSDACHGAFTASKFQHFLTKRHKRALNGHVQVPGMHQRTSLSLFGLAGRVADPDAAAWLGLCQST